MTVVASNYARKENDLYQTEPWATEALIRQFPVRGMTVWEPAAGNHLMADVLRDHGASVCTSDIAVYDRPHNAIFDFLLDRPHDEPSIQAIITNPPYGKSNRDAVKFARLALERCDGLVALLLTAKFDFGKTRTDLFRDNPRFWAKIALVDRIQWFPGDSSGTEDHAWYVWGPKGAVYSPRIIWEGRELFGEAA
ncbi:hypothetical protein EDC40_103675 [Aminobacter aminovorans]|uniref:Methyltransferase n=1 Tax=Aminobacter aminovorans TaxID=83263 RepID=A0A380WK80_AMIAI|nr:hypothetical protein [Aminobacter aminovorans]TCS28206.1 hypothetical protein EDC40_103675 [Aminobacter aminovorans]SUU89383.1 Uncharacterised protein [Aminobacter aminovorans]